MKCKKMGMGLILVIALLMGVLVVTLPPEKLEYLVLVSRFFEAMMPVLAVGALIKYLCSCSTASNCVKCEPYDKGINNKV